MPHPHRTTAADRTQADIRAVSERLDFMQLSPQDCMAIRSLKDMLQRELPVALDQFYAQVRKTPEMMRFFSSENVSTLFLLYKFPMVDKISAILRQIC
ncbi:MAG: protoglobin domain-containing protein [Komagataeibacter saccharivorans]|uniref:protoglobin domain-containing protein n=1 Tax=Komagataeibacter saccharivorans TaxID=265959 RepID=UPI0039EBA600